MITTRRPERYSATDNSVRGGVDLLEREVAYETVAPQREESREEAKARMQRNLDRLLNYDRYSEMEAEEPRERNSILFPVKAKGEVRFRSVVSFGNFGSMWTPMVISVFSRPS